MWYDWHHCYMAWLGLNQVKKNEYCRTWLPILGKNGTQNTTGKWQGPICGVNKLCGIRWVDRHVLVATNNDTGIRATLVFYTVTISKPVCYLGWGLSTDAKQAGAQKHPQGSKTSENKEIQAEGSLQIQTPPLLVGHKWWFRGIVFTWVYNLLFKKVLHIIPLNTVSESLNSTWNYTGLSPPLPDSSMVTTGSAVDRAAFI